MTLVTKNKDIYERILNGDLNFSEGEIQLEVLVEFFAFATLKENNNVDSTINMFFEILFFISIIIIISNI